jgi:hypothetical protein
MKCKRLWVVILAVSMSFFFLGLQGIPAAQAQKDAVSKFEGQVGEVFFGGDQTPKGGFVLVNAFFKLNQYPNKLFWIYLPDAYKFGLLQKGQKKIDIKVIGDRLKGKKVSLQCTKDNLTKEQLATQKVEEQYHVRELKWLK